MSKIGIAARLTAIREAAARIDPRIAAVHRMEPATRLRYENWRRECSAMLKQAEQEGGPGASFEAMLEGRLELPRPPRAVREALAIEDAPTIPRDASMADVAELYRQMVE
jgi:hypothetical protein